VQCVFWDPSKGTVLGGTGRAVGCGAVPGAHGWCPVPVAGHAGGWSSGGCSIQRGDERTVCFCDHLTFFTLLLVTAPLPAAPAPTPAVLPAPPGWPLGCHQSCTGAVGAAPRQAQVLALSPAPALEGGVMLGSHLLVEAPRKVLVVVHHSYRSSLTPSQ